MHSPILIIAAILLPILFIVVGYAYDYRQDKKRFIQTIKGVLIAIISIILSYIFMQEAIELVGSLLDKII
jgi:hypothetical protein